MPLVLGEPQLFEENPVDLRLCKFVAPGQNRAWFPVLRPWRRVHHSAYSVRRKIWAPVQNDGPGQRNVLLFHKTPALRERSVVGRVIPFG